MEVTATHITPEEKERAVLERHITRINHSLIATDSNLVRIDYWSTIPKVLQDKLIDLYQASGWKVTLSQSKKSAFFERDPDYKEAQDA